MKRMFHLSIVLILVISLFIGCGAPSSAKLEKTKDLAGKFAKAFAEQVNEYKGKSLFDLPDDNPEVVDKVLSSEYPYDPDKTIDDVYRPDLKFEDGKVVAIFRIPIGDEDKKIAEKITGKKADRYYVETKIIVELDKEVKSYDDLDNAKIKKATYTEPEVVAED